MQNEKIFKKKRLVKNIIVLTAFFISITLISSSSMSVTLNKMAGLKNFNVKEEELIINKPLTGLAPRINTEKSLFKTAFNDKNEFNTKVTNNIELLKRTLMYGYIAYGYDEGPCYFPIEGGGNFTFLGPTGSDDFLSGGTWTPDERWICCEYGSGVLWDIDPYDGTMTSIGGGGQTMNGLGWDPLKNQMYGIGNTDDLFMVDYETGETELVGNGGTGQTMIALAFDIYGCCYSWDVKASGESYLYSVDVETGACTPIGGMGKTLCYAQDGDILFTENRLILTAYIYSPEYGGYLCEVNKVTGELTTLCPFEGVTEIDASMFQNCYLCQYEHDIGVKEIINPENGEAGEGLEVNVKVKNYGNEEEDVPLNVVILKDGIFEEYNETQYIDVLNPGVEMNVEMPVWTPDDWQNVDNEYIDYKITAHINLSGDQYLDNNLKEKWFELYFKYSHDVGCINLNGPESGPAQTFPVSGTIKNFGQYEECCFKTYVEIAELDIEDPVESLTQDFSDSTFPPSGWVKTHNNWMYNNSNHAGGSYGEARFYWYPSSTDYFRLYTPAINIGDYGAIKIDFKHTVDHQTTPYTLQVETSNDGINWDVVWHINPEGSISCQDISILTAQNVGSNTYVSWTFNGDSSNIDNWYVDDIIISGYEYFEPEYQDYRCTDTIDPDEEQVLEFDDWTPEFLSEETTATKKYLVKAWTDMEEPLDENPYNDLFTKIIDLEFFHDVGIKEITSPNNNIRNIWPGISEGCGALPEVYLQPGTQDIEALVENIGTFPELDLTCYAEIYEYITDPENGSLVYEDNITDIDLDTPLGGTETLVFDDFTFTNEGVYGLYLDIPLIVDDYPENNLEELIIGVDDTGPVSWIENIEPPEPDGDNGWYVSDVEITICAEDPEIFGVSSGVKAIIVNGQAYYGVDCVTIIIDGDKDNYPFEFWAIDNVGNEESHKTFTIDIDQTNPIMEMEWETYKQGGPWYVRFTCTATDATSKMDRVEMYIDDVFYETITGPVPTYEFTIKWSKDLKTSTFKFEAFDIAGNSASVIINGSDIKSCSNIYVKQFSKNLVIQFLGKISTFQRVLDLLGVA